MPQHSDSLVQWLYTNAPAAWASALFAMVTCIFLLWSRKRPKRIIVKHIAGSSLVNVWPSVKGKIKLTFEDRLINSLGQVDAVLFNEGSDVIQEPAVTIVLPKESIILATLLSPRSLQATSSLDGNRVTVSIPYLNPIRDHGHVVHVSLLIDGGIEPIRVIGTGEGWSARFRPQATIGHIARVFAFATIYVASILVGTPFYSRYVEVHFGITASELSLRAFLASIPFLILILGPLTFVVRLANQAAAGLKPRDIGGIDGDDA